MGDLFSLISIPTSEELVTFFDQGMLANEMARRFRLDDKADIQEVEVRCVALHNAGTIDLFRLVESKALQMLNDTDFFRATHFFCSVLLALDATPSRMMACVEALVARGGEDLGANQPNATFRAWCKKDPRRAREVITMARDGDDLASRNLTFALEAINAITEARQIALEYDDSRRLSAITALGRINDDDPFSRTETLSTFNALPDSGDDDNLRANMLSATAAILARNLDTHSPEVATLVNKILENPGKNTVHSVAHMLWAYQEALRPDIVDTLLQALGNIDSANKGTVKELDLGLEALMKAGHDEAAIAFVTNLLSRSDDSLELDELNSFTRSLVSGSSERLSRVVVQWLLLGTPSLCDGLANALQGHDLEGPPLNLRAEHLAISSLSQVFLCRKAIGWFFVKPTTAASILVSVLRICAADTALEVQNLLVKTLLINYKGVRDYLKGLAPDDAAKARVDRALAENEEYLSALQAIPLFKELQPSEHQRRIERLRMSDQMRDAHKQAQSKSVFLSLVKHSVLLYGNHSLSFIKAGNGALRPMEMDLKPYRVSFEIPRMEIVDPVGLDYTLRVFRMERMGS